MEVPGTLILVPPSESPEHAAVLREAGARKGSPGDLLCLPLGYMGRGIISSLGSRIRTPESYFDKAGTSLMNVTALKLARTWYADLDDSVIFQGVNVAQMCEYWFYFVFVDCLRSLAIARSILESERPGAILLPRTTMAREISEICYETLPNALEALAPTYGVKTERVLGQESRTEGGSAGTGGGISGRARAYERSVEMIAPLQGSGRVPFIQVYAYDKLAASARARGLKPLRCVPYSRDTAASRSFSSELKAMFQRFGGTIHEGARPSGSEEELSRAIGLHRFEEFFIRLGPMLSGYVEWTRYYTSKVHPKVVVAMEDVTPVKRCMARTFREQGVDTVVLQHGLYAEDTARLLLMPVEGKVQAVWGEYHSKWLAAHGKSKESEVVVGAPHFEDIVVPESKIEAARANLGLDSGARLILVGTSRYASINSAYTLEKEERFFDRVYQGLEGLDEYKIVTKLHPACSHAYSEMAEDYASRHGIKTTLTKSFLRELMSTTEIVIIPTSTIGYDAVRMRKPLVCVDFEDTDNVNVFLEGQVAVGATDGVQIHAAIEKALDLVHSSGYEAARDRFLESHLNTGHGEASDNVAELIEREIRSTASKGRAKEAGAA